MRNFVSFKLIQNAAAIILTGIEKTFIQFLDPCTGFQLYRIEFKTLLIVYKSLNGLGPNYIADMSAEYKPGRYLQGQVRYRVPTVQTICNTALNHYAAHCWNQLKTVLFSTTFN